MPVDVEGVEWPITHGPVRSWARDQYSTGAYNQARDTARAKGVVHPVALMPDAHVGIGACVGSVVATEGTIIPACVGVDIGCGMSAVRLNLTAEDLPDDLSPALSAIAAAVPPTAHSDSGRRPAGQRWLAERGGAPSGLADMGRAAVQFGTLGSGNHFLEVSLDRSERVWLVVHSGSRGVGNYLARQHIRTASKLDSDAPSKDLAALDAGTAEFDAYVADMHWAQDYAFANREAMLAAAMLALGRVIDRAPRVAEKVRCHHNYAEEERHGGRTVYVTRKGAIRAQVGDRGIIPGSMGASTFIVRGLGNVESYESASHGAGRVMSRTQAKRTLSVEEMAAQMEGRVWLSDRAGSLIDEAPNAYKNIHDVMSWQSDLCAIEDELTAIVNYKGA